MLWTRRIGSCLLATLPLVLWTRTMSHVRPLVQTVWAGDTLMLADSGARLLEGKAPHSDYFSPIGVLTQAVIAIGLWCKDMDIAGAFDAAEWASVLAALAIFGLARRARVPWMVSFGLAAVVLECTVSLRPLGYRPGLVSLTGLYNRLGWALLIALMLDLFAIVEGIDVRRAGILSGLILSLLLATKLNLALAGLALLAPLVFLKCEARARVARRLGATFVLGTAAWLVVFRISPLAFVRDQGVVLAAMPLERKMAALVDVVQASWSELLVSVAFVGAVSFATRRAPVRRPLMRTWIFTGGVVAASLAAAVGSIAKDEMVLLFVSPILAMSLVPASRRSWMYAFAATAVAALSARTLQKNLESYRVRREHVAHLDNVDRYQRIDSPRLRDFYLMTSDDQYGVPAMERVARERTTEFSPATFAIQANHGLALLQFRLRDRQTLLTLFNDQSYAYFAGASHVAGDALFYHVGRANSMPLPTDIDAVVAKADWILTPREEPTWGDLEVIRSYFPAVRARFNVVAENEYWKLWAK